MEAIETDAKYYVNMTILRLLISLNTITYKKIKLQSCEKTQKVHEFWFWSRYVFKMEEYSDLHNNVKRFTWLLTVFYTIGTQILT